MMAVKQQSQSLPTFSDYAAALTSSRKLKEEILVEEQAVQVLDQRATYLGVTLPQGDTRVQLILTAAQLSRQKIRHLVSGHQKVVCMCTTNRSILAGGRKRKCGYEGGEGGPFRGRTLCKGSRFGAEDIQRSEGGLFWRTFVGNHVQWTLKDIHKKETLISQSWRTPRYCALLHSTSLNSTVQR